ncbi:hypothetical protein BDZ89DRAFT_1110357 [Hymenopellis radicata]|nr:hypothetical protein BDZ89DRAFT_1110357 [Hymenopellis radicata]
MANEAVKVAAGSSMPKADDTAEEHPLKRVKTTTTMNPTPKPSPKRTHRTTVADASDDDDKSPPDKPPQNSTSTNYDGLVGPEGVNNEVRLGIDGTDGLNANKENVVAASPSRFPVPADNDTPSLSFLKGSEAQMSAIPAVQSKPLSRRNSTFIEPAPKNVASVAAPVVFVSPITQDEVARFQAALAGLPPGSSRPKTSKRKAELNPTDYASRAFQHPQVRRTELPSYGYVIPSISRSELALTTTCMYQALYEFPHTYMLDIMLPVLIQWIDIHRVPDFPKERDAGRCWRRG